jgi:hypothetical protein
MQPRLSRAAWIAVTVGLVLVVLSVVSLALESRYRSCVAAAEARYPAVAVSAFNSRTTGPVKLSYVTERQAAVGDCGRF